MVVKKAVLDMEVKVDDSELEATTAGIASRMERLQRQALGVANVLGEIGKTKTAITTLAALTKEAINTAAGLAEIDKQLLAITKSEPQARRAFESIKRMVEYKPPAGAGTTGLRPDFAPAPRPDPLTRGSGRRLAGIQPGVLPAVLSIYSPAVIGGILNRYDPLLKDAAERYFVKDPRLSEYMLGTTPGFMYGAGRAGIDRARGGYQPPPDPAGTAAWDTMKGWGGYPERRPFGAGQHRRKGTQERPLELRTESYEFVKGDRADEVETAKLESLEVIEEEKAKNHDKELKRIEEMAESYASYVDPAPYIVEGLKSGDMRQAIEDFAVALGTRVAEELVHKLIVMGIMAVLSMLTGGGAQGATMFMRRGGVIKAQRGLLGVLPPRPGGHYFPWGDQLVNAAEAGQPEALGIFPPGKAGQDLILGPLARMFNIPVMPPNVMISPAATPAPEVNVETRPVNNITVKVENADRHHIQAHNAAIAGKVNKAVTVRK